MVLISRAREPNSHLVTVEAFLSVNSTGETGVLRKDRVVFREKVAFKPKQKSLRGRVES